MSACCSAFGDTPEAALAATAVINVVVYTVYVWLVGRAGAVFARLHGSGAVFPFRFELFAMIDDYLRVLAPMDVALPPGYHDVVAEAQTLRAVLARAEVPLVACHCG